MAVTTDDHLRLDAGTISLSPTVCHDLVMIWEHDVVQSELV